MAGPSHALFVPEGGIVRVLPVGGGQCLELGRGWLLGAEQAPETVLNGSGNSHQAANCGFRCGISQVG